MGVPLTEAIEILTLSAKKGLDLHMPADGRYQPADLKPYLGYDQWGKWLALVEWYWLETLAEAGVIPESTGQLLHANNLEKVLRAVTTTKQDERERETKHDIIALQDVMRPALPAKLQPWLHYGATSYDIIESAYALQAKVCFKNVFLPKLHVVDCLWREHLRRHANTLQAGRTHLQTALPVTVGFWLANLHQRFVTCAREAEERARLIPGKFSGACGTYASQRALIPNSEALEGIFLEKLDLAHTGISTQITPPEARARFYHELVLLSGALGNLGEDVRILQCSQFGEVTSDSSTSSAMSHKDSNPIAAENMAGMHEIIKAEYGRVINTLISDLQRDLRASCVMRGFPSILVYGYQQLLGAERLLRSLVIKEDRCEANFWVKGNVVAAEALHLSLQELGVPVAHHFVNSVVVPRALQDDVTLAATVRILAGELTTPISPAICERLQSMPVWPYLESPDRYIGDAKKLALREAENCL